MPPHVTWAESRISSSDQVTKQCAAYDESCSFRPVCRNEVGGGKSGKLSRWLCTVLASGWKLRQTLIGRRGRPCRLNRDTDAVIGGGRHARGPAFPPLPSRVSSGPHTDRFDWPATGVLQPITLAPPTWQEATVEEKNRGKRDLHRILQIRSGPEARISRQIFACEIPYFPVRPQPQASTTEFFPSTPPAPDSHPRIQSAEVLGTSTARLRYHKSRHGTTTENPATAKSCSLPLVCRFLIAILAEASVRSGRTPSQRASLLLSRVS